MASVQYAAFVALITLAIGFSVAAANFTIPFLSPAIGEEGCKTDVCGKGKCVPSSDTAFGFECQCEKGWKQSRPDDDHFFKFLPCVIPNCSINFKCDGTPAPAPTQKQSNYSVFDSCYWTDCGGGSCNKTSAFTHSCVCQEGYYNLFNSSTFPCYKECGIGGDCMNLGIGLTNSSNLSPPQPQSTSSVGDSESHASSLIISTGSSWLIAMVATLATFVWM